MRTNALENRQWILARRPVGTFAEQDFELRRVPVPDLKDGQVLLRILYLSLDPSNRIWAREEASYAPPVAVGEVMRGFAIGRVMESRNAAYPEGALLSGFTGWEDYMVTDCAGMARAEMPEGIPLEARFAIFEHIGTPAYIGLTEIGKLKKGDTVVVSAAAGAVGSLAVQMAKNLGAGRVVAIAGSDAKCRWLTDELGADVAVNYKRGNLGAALAAACPDGVDVFFDNVGGETLEAVLELINMNARIAMCGAISGYDSDCKQPGPSNLSALLFKRAKMEGFICLDYAGNKAIWEKAHSDITKWYREGRLKYRLDVVEGLENAPKAVIKLSEGKNEGKLLVKVSSESDR